MRQSRFFANRKMYEEIQKETELARLKAENEQLKEQLQRCNTQIRAANEQIGELQKRYTALVNELDMKEKAADQISRMALKEANQIIENAKGNADLIVKEAMSQARSVFIEISRLSRQTLSMKGDIQNKLASMNEMLQTFRIPEVPNLEYLTEEKERDEKKKSV